MVFKQLLFCSLILTSINNIVAQIDGGNGFLMGNYVNVAINGEGGKEGTYESGAGFHQRGPGSRCGFVSDPNMSDWDPLLFHGDYFAPGTFENGFGLEIEGVNYSNNYDLVEIEATSPMTHNIDGDCISVDWFGEVEDVEIQVTYKLNMNALYYTTEIKLINTSDDDLTNVYYYRSFDPDNNQTLSAGYSTENTIVSQPDSSCLKALVSATQLVPELSYCSLGAIGADFRVTYGGFSNRSGSEIWSGDGIGGLEDEVGAFEVSDVAISIAYKTDLAAGDSTTFLFVVALSHDASDDAFNQNYHLNYLTEGGESGPVWVECTDDPVDSIYICTGEEVMLHIEGDIVDDYDWTWSPAEGLTTTEGDTTYATPDTIVTYTISPDIGDCYSLTPRQIVILASTGILDATISDDITILGGESTTLTASGGDTYSWTPIDGLSDPLAATTDAAPAETTVYTCTIALDSYDCEEVLEVTVTVIDGSGINDFGKYNAITIYPNPFNDFTILDFGNTLDHPHSVVVYDLLGQVVYKAGMITGETVVLNATNLASGSYILSLFNADTDRVFSTNLMVK